MDIKSLKPVREDEGRFVQFPDAAGNPLYDGEEAVGAVVSGTFSKYYRDAHRKLREASMRQARLAAARGDDPTDEQLVNAGEDQELALEAACIRSWTLTADGQPFPITVENWKVLVDDQPQWRTRVQRQMQDHASFFNAG